MADRAAQQRADARQHLLEMERLRHIIVGAGIEALHLVAPAVARGEQQHRHGAAGTPPRLQHRNTVELGQADVEDDGVVGLGLAEVMPFLAVEGAVDHVTGIGQRGRELTVEIGIVLDDEEAHSVPPGLVDSPCGSRQRQPGNTQGDLANSFGKSQFALSIRGLAAYCVNTAAALLR